MPSNMRRGDVVGYPASTSKGFKGFSHKGEIEKIYPIEGADDLLRVKGLPGVVSASCVELLIPELAGDRCLDPSWCGATENNEILFCTNGIEDMPSQPIEEIHKPTREDLENAETIGAAEEAMQFYQDNLKKQLAVDKPIGKIKDGVFSPATIEQPAPVKTWGKPVWEIVIQEMHDRNQMGTKKYGTPLQAGNGRDALVDLYQELLDACVYTRQEMINREHSKTRERSVLEWISKHGCGELDNGTKACQDGTHVKGCAAEMAISVLKETKK